MPDVPSMKDRPLQPKRLSAVREREDETKTETPEAWGFPLKREMFADRTGSKKQKQQLGGGVGVIFFLGEGGGAMKCLTWAGCTSIWDEIIRKFDENFDEFGQSLGTQIHGWQ